MADGYERIEGRPCQCGGCSACLGAQGRGEGCGYCGWDDCACAECGDCVERCDCADEMRGAA